MDFYTDGKEIHGYEIIYKSENNSNAVSQDTGKEVFEVGHHIGTMLNPSVERKTIVLEEGEDIIGLVSYNQNLVDRLEFKTSKGRDLAVGKQDVSGYTKTSVIPEGQKLIAMDAGMGGHIHHIICYYQ